MNLLGHSDNMITDSILSLLRSMKLDNVWMDKAEKFFDFTREKDLSLLEGKVLGILELWSTAVSEKAKKVVSDIRKETDMEYSDRYILFMDAIDTTRKMVYDYYNYEFSLDDDMSDPCYHAFSLVCNGDHQTKARLLANYIYESSYYYGCDLSEMSIKIGEKDPRMFYEAGKFRNTVRFYAFALAFSEKPEGNVFTENEIGEMTEYLYDKIRNANLSNDNEYQFFMTVMFLSHKYNEKINKLMLDSIKGREEVFFTGVIKNTPENYLSENTATLFDITKKFMSTQDVIKATILSAYNHPQLFSEKGISDRNGNGALAMLSFEARNYPDDYFAVMKCRDKFTGINAIGHVPDHYYVYYDHLFTILEKENPDAARRLSSDRYGDMVKLFIETEVENCGAPEEVGQYLRGEKDISVLLPKKDDIVLPDHNRSFTDYHIECIIYALRDMPEYKNRYIAFKTIQDMFSIRCYVQSIIYKMRCEKEYNYSPLIDFIGSLIKENVFTEQRFALYQEVDGYCFYGDDPLRTGLYNTILDVMVSHSEDKDSEYEMLTIIKNVYARRLYADYLGKTDVNTDKHKNCMLTLCADTSKEVRRTVTTILGQHREYAPQVTQMLSAKKAALRETAVDIISVWGAEDFREALEKAADCEKSAKLADKIRGMLGAAAGGEGKAKDFAADSFIDDMLKGGRAKKLSWLYETPLPQVHKKDGTPADDKYMQAMLLAYSAVTSPERPAAADRLAGELNERELQAFAAQVFSKWYSAGAEAKKKQYMYFAAAYGGSELVDEMIRCVKDWAENMRGAIAAETIKAVALNGSSQALMAVDNIAHKFKHKQVRTAAAEAIGNAAKILGITAEELGDRIVPDMGFDISKKRVFDYGARKFNVYLTADLSLEVTDETGKKLKALPAPGKKDDEEKAKAEYSEYKQLKKQLKNVVSIQSSRLESALSSDRRWNRADWEKLFVNNPIMHSFAEGLVWAAYVDGGCDCTFRYMDDGSFSTADSDEYELPEGCTIGLVHPLELDEETLSAWKEQLSDYEITQPFLQLDRPVYRLNEDEKGKLDVTRFSGRSLGGYTIVGRTDKLGWYRGSVQDGGGFYEFYREDVTSKETLPDGTEKLTGCAAEFSFSGLSIGYYEDDVTIENLRFYHPGDVARGSYVYDKADDKKAIPLDLVNPRYFSEIIYQMEQITRTG